MAIKRYRVKDFAAFYVARIKEYELPFEQDLMARDESIEKVRKDLGL